METYTFEPLELKFDNEDAWELICSGKTKGVFQLESNLGKSWAKRVQPRNIEELSALISIIRPGTLKAIVDGKSMTQHYVDRKNGVEEITYLHPSLEPILKGTQGVLVYQEQSMQIAQQLAGFNLQEADNLRKAIGKKKADLMAKVKQDFLKGSSEKGIITTEEAEEIFSWIEKSSRYAFNKSHAVSYAICAYWSAYAKFHFPLEFYCNYLIHSSGKPDPQREVRELVNDAKNLDIHISPPSIKSLNTKTDIIDNQIHFGLIDIKSVGMRQVDKFRDAVMFLEQTLGKSLCETSWYEFLIIASQKINSRMLTALISIGFFSGLPETRQQMLDEFDTWSNITIKEAEWAEENFEDHDNLTSLLKVMIPVKKDGGAAFNSKRSQIMADLVKQCEKPSYSLKDDSEWVIRTEENYLGIALTYSRIEAHDISLANTTIKEFIDGKRGNIKMAVTVSEVKKYVVKKGKSIGLEMAFLCVEDTTGTMDTVTVFNDQWLSYKNILYEGNNIIMIGQDSKKKRYQLDDGFILNEVIELS
jgi:DNA polymerase III alpha subunit|tara:strand:+ start:1068 stop:2660 length:1593 start_codon:yes stop_codon:yes gene_type:complete